MKIDAEAARQCPGVVHVLVPADVAALGRLPLLVPHASLLAPVCSEILPQEIVSYVGQPVGVVVAESAAQAEDALAAFVPLTSERLWRRRFATKLLLQPDTTKLR